MTTRAPAFALFTFPSSERRPSQPLNTSSAAILSLRLVQVLYWLLVLFL
jgi:hypothetical protein